MTIPPPVRLLLSVLVTALLYAVSQPRTPDHVADASPAAPGVQGAAPRDHFPSW